MSENSERSVVFLNFLGDQWYSILIFTILFFGALYLYNQFQKRATKYTALKPKEAMLLTLLCRRWENSTRNTMGAILIIAVTAFIAFIMVELGKDISDSQNDFAPYSKILMYAEVAALVFMSSIMAMSLWNAKGAYNDLKKSDL